MTQKKTAPKQRDADRVRACQGRSNGVDELTVRRRAATAAPADDPQPQ